MRFWWQFGVNKHVFLSKFFKDKKISQACSAYLHQIAQKSFCYLLIIYMKNVS